MFTEFGHGCSAVCADAMFSSFEEDERVWEQEKQAREAAFRFELVECKPGPAGSLEQVATRSGHPEIRSRRVSLL